MSCAGIVDLALHVRDHLGRVEPAKPAAREGEYLKGLRHIVGHGGCESWRLVALYQREC
jgi:hypothetical protein